MDLHRVQPHHDALSPARRDEGSLPCGRDARAQLPARNPLQHTAQVRGHVVDGRYWSRRVESEPYLLAAFRYIVRNAIEAGLCVSRRIGPGAATGISSSLAEQFSSSIHLASPAAGRRATPTSSSSVGSSRAPVDQPPVSGPGLAQGVGGATSGSCRRSALTLDPHRDAVQYAVIAVLNVEVRTGTWLISASKVCFDLLLYRTASSSQTRMR